jgi:chemotaxis signal transduction protein
MSAYLVFRIGEESFAVPVGQVLEVAELGTLTPVPGAPASVLGVRNLRGQILPVIDLAAILGTPRTRQPDKLVVAEEGGRRAGLALEDVTEVAILDDAMQDVESPFLSGSTIVGGELVEIVDIDGVFAAVSRGGV